MGKGRKHAIAPAPAAPSEEPPKDDVPAATDEGSAPVEAATDEPTSTGMIRDGAEPRPLLSLEDEADLMVEEASNDEWAYRQAERLVGELPERTGGADRRTEGEVFDHPTLMVLHRLLTHGVLKSLDFPVATGKEANVFRGTTPRGGLVAVKIYRVNTATFKHVIQYIEGDERFQGKTGDRRALVASWCQKEFRNMARMRDAGCSVPEPLKAIGNVLVMEYLGTREGQWPRLKEMTPIKDAQRIYEEVAADYVKAYNKADLVHADLSEYNIMLEGTDKEATAWRPRMIDVGQAVLKSHPRSKEFLERDVKNLTSFFRRQGATTDPQDIIAKLDHTRRQERERPIKVRPAKWGLDDDGSEEE